jgi:hypothetical protein
MAINKKPRLAAAVKVLRKGAFWAVDTITSDGGRTLAVSGSLSVLWVQSVGFTI